MGKLVSGDKVSILFENKVLDNYYDVVFMHTANNVTWVSSERRGNQIIEAPHEIMRLIPEKECFMGGIRGA